MAEGPLGFFRPLGVGPLTEGGLLFGQPQDAQAMNEEVVEIAENMGIDINTTDPDEIEQVRDELAERVFPESERKQERLKNCIDSEWGEDWTEGFREVSGTGDSTPLEELSTAANGCRGMVEANTLG